MLDYIIGGFKRTYEKISKKSIENLKG